MPRLYLHVQEQTFRSDDRTRLRLGNRQREADRFLSSRALRAISLINQQLREGKLVRPQTDSVTVAFSDDANRLELFGLKEVLNWPYSAHVFCER
jgi:hypothetical protein